MENEEMIVDNFSEIAEELPDAEVTSTDNTAETTAPSETEPDTTKRKRGVKKAGRKRTKTGAGKKTSTKTGVKSRVVSATNKQVLDAVNRDKGINAHYGINEELPTFLL